MLLTQLSPLLVIFSFLFRESLSENNMRLKLANAIEKVNAVKDTFLAMFSNCMDEPLNDNRFGTENLQQYVNSDSKTTVGFAPKFTQNRRFFANMIATPQFKQMLAEDEEELRKNYVKKMKYCDDMVMDQTLLKDFYDRETE